MGTVLPLLLCVPLEPTPHLPIASPTADGRRAPAGSSDMACHRLCFWWIKKRNKAGRDLSEGLHMKKRISKIRSRGRPQALLCVGDAGGDTRRA